MAIARLVVGRAVGFLGTVRVAGSGSLLVAASVGLGFVALVDGALMT